MKAVLSSDANDPTPSPVQEAASASSDWRVAVDLPKLIDQLPGFVFRLRHGVGPLQCDFASANCQEVCGLPIDDLRDLALRLVDRIDPQDLATFRASLQASVATGFWNWEGRLHTQHGLKWVNVRARTRSVDALTAESTGIMINVTQSHQRESQLLTLSTDLRQMASHLESVREAERARMARDLHDDLGQVLTALQMDVALLRRQFGATDSAELFGNVDKLIRAAAEAGRRVAAELRPSVLDLGLKAALRWMAEQYAKRYNIRVQTDLIYQREVDDLIATELFRIAQEGLTNVVRHAKARQAWVRCVDAQDGQICISVEDDGRGYTPQDASASRPSLGLRGMRERAAVFGGSFQLGPSAHGGLRIQVCMPLTAGAEHG
ncbi:MAG: sensor histidine kinase [Thiomonas sp.]|nr:sensor histidine kinase [Thiomonas sp.]